MEEDVLTTPEAAAELGIGVRRVLALIASGRLKARQAGKYWLVRRADLDAVRDRPTGRPRKPVAPEARKRKRKPTPPSA